MQKFSNYFLAGYEKYDYLTNARAKLLLFFLSIFILFSFMLQFSMLFAGWYDFIVTLPVSSFLLIGLVIGLVLLRKGRYLLSANIFITFAATAVIAGLIRQPFQEINLSYTSYIYFIFPVVAMCAIFSNVRFLTFICGLLIVADIALFVIMRQMSQSRDQKMIVIAFNNTIFLHIAFVYIISLLIMKIFQKSVDIANMESQKNLDANTFIKKILRESSGKVVAAMQEMSGQSDKFSRSANDQASSISDITGTIETISRGIDDVSNNAKEQNVNLNSLIAILDELSEHHQEPHRAGCGFLIRLTSETPQDVTESDSAGCVHMVIV